VHPYKSKNQVIRSYEVGLSVFLREAGFKPGAVVPVESLRVGWPLPKKSYNPTVKAPMQLLHKGMPFVKGELLRDNPRHQRLGPVLREMARAGYPLELIEFDRPSSTSLRARVSELWASLRARPLGTD
jgi:hypothetical protein